MRQWIWQHPGWPRFTWQDAQLAPVLQFQRQASWRIDFINAENSMGFHAPQESARILGEACDFARRGQIELLRIRQSAAPAAPPAAPAK